MPHLFMGLSQPLQEALVFYQRTETCKFSQNCTYCIHIYIKQTYLGIWLGTFTIKCGVPFASAEHNLGCYLNLCLLGCSFFCSNKCLLFWGGKRKKEKSTQSMENETPCNLKGINFNKLCHVLKRCKKI